MSSFTEHVLLVSPARLTITLLSVHLMKVELCPFRFLLFQLPLTIALNNKSEER